MMQRIIALALLLSGLALPALAADPVYNSVGVLGTVSGTVTMKGQGAVGTWNWNFPTSAGTSGQVLLSGGGGTTAMTWGSVGIAGGGTGRASLTTHGVLIGEGTSAINQTSAMTNGQLLVGATGADPAPQTMSGDCTFATGGAITCTKTNGSAFVASATTDTTSATNISSGTLNAARLATSGVTAATYGDGTHVPQIIIDVAGRITSASSVAITGAAPTGSAGGDLSGSYPNPTVAKVNGVSFPSGPSTDTVPVITGANTVTWEALPNSALANPSTTVNGQTCTLGSSCSISATLASIADGDLLANTSGSAAAPVATTLTGLIDYTLGSTSADFLVRGASNWAAVAMSGDAALSNTGGLTLATVNSNTGTWGDGTHVGQFTVDGKGRITAASSVTITGAAPTGSAGGDLSGTFPNPTVAKVNGVSYGSSPSTNTVAVVTGSNTTTYQTVPNAALANSSITVNGTSCTLGSSCTPSSTSGFATAMSSASAARIYGGL
jgi:hypothetical protein